MFTNKQIWRVAYPILISLFVQNFINITDTAFLGRVGEVELGASALAGVFYMAIYMVGFGFSTGSQILMARRNGERRYAAIGAIMLQGTLFLIGLAALMFVLSWFFSPILLSRLIESKPVYEASSIYLNYRAFGLFFSFIGVMFRAFFVGITQTKILTVNAAVMAVVNIVFNYLLIFGKCGFPEMGIAGSAIASVIAEFSSVIFYTVYTLRKIDVRKYAFFSRNNFDVRVIFQILSVSVWTMIQYFLTIGTWFLFFVAVEHLGERQLAISNVIRSLSTLLFMPVSAFAATASTLVSNLMGMGRSDLVFPTYWRIVRLSLFVLLPLMCLLCLFPQWAIRIYSDNQDLIWSCVPVLYVMVSFYFIAIPGSILFNTVSGTGNTRSALFIESATLVFYVLAIYVIVLRSKADIAFCWLVEHVYWSVMLLLSWLYMKKANWQSKKI